MWGDGKGRGLSELVGWVRYLSQCWGSLFQRGGTATGMERLENLSDEVTEGRSSVEPVLSALLADLYNQLYIS